MDVSTQAPVLSRERLAHAAQFDPRQIRRTVKDIEGFNAKLALIIKRTVGTMACAYVFTLIALISLPAVLIEAGVLTNSDVPKFFTKPGLILVVSWVAQTFLQLVLLSVIMAPVLAFLLVAGYGFLVWMIQLAAGPPGAKF